MKQQWETISLKVDAMSRRGRLLVLATLIVIVSAVINVALLEPAFTRQKVLRSGLQERQDKMTAVQAQIRAIQQAHDVLGSSPQHRQLAQVKQDLAEGNALLQRSREKLVQPQNMAEHLRQLLGRNSRLQLLALHTLPVTPLLEPAAGKAEEVIPPAQAETAASEPQVYKHGVQITVRGSYLDLLQYVQALESMPQQMYWAKAQLTVVQYPTSELTLVLYTLSLDKTWLQI